MNKFIPKDYWENRLNKLFDLCGVGYIGLSKNYNNWLYKIKRDVFLQNIKSIDLDCLHANVLDVGCGTGFYIERWKELNAHKIVGIDITNCSVDNLSQKYPDIEFHQVDIGDNIQKLPTNNFDVISCFDVLYHIVDDTQFEMAISNIYSLLKPGGLFIWSDNFLHHKKFSITHQVSRTLNNIEKICDSVGFQILERRPMFFLMNDPIDSQNPLLKLYWNIISRIVKYEILGLVIGAFLYPLELMLTKFAKESPSIEIMICKRKNN